MNENPLYVTRKLTKDECFWLKTEIPAGLIVYEVSDFWGCCTSNGIMVSFKSNRDVPHLEVPKDSVKPYIGAIFSNN